MDQPSSAEESTVTLRIKFKSGSLGEFIARYGADVSPGGIFIRTRDPLSVGTRLRFDFGLANGTPMLAGVGTVVWVREYDAARANAVPGMGVRFDNLTSESQGVLANILSDKARPSVARPTAPTPVVVPAIPERAQRRTTANVPIVASGLDSFEDEKTQVMSMNNLPRPEGPTDQDLPAHVGGRDRSATEPELPYTFRAPTPPVGVAPPFAPTPSAAFPQSRPPTPPDGIAANGIGLSGLFTPTPTSTIGEQRGKAPLLDPFSTSREPGSSSPFGAPAAQVKLPLAPPATPRGGGTSTWFVILGVAALAGAGGFWFLNQDRAPGAGQAELPAAPPANAVAPKAPAAVAENPSTEPAAKAPGAPQADGEKVAGESAAGAAVAGDPPVAAAVPPPVAAQAAPPAPPAAAAKAEPASPPPPTPSPAVAPPPTAKPVVAARPRPVPVRAPQPQRRPAAAVAASAAEETEAAPAEDIYFLRVRSVPAGAEVLIDGQLEGKTPFQRRIFDIDRPYAVTVRKEGFEAHEQMLSASDDWAKQGNTHTLVIAPKLARASASAPSEAAPAESAPTESAPDPAPPAESPPTDDPPAAP